MVFQKGHKLGKGKKGVSGRKTIAEELDKVLMISNAWFNEGINPNKLQAVIKKAKETGGNIRMYDLYMLKGLSSEKILMDQAKKVFPDKVENSGTVKVSFIDWVKQVNGEEEQKEEKET